MYGRVSEAISSGLTYKYINIVSNKTITQEDRNAVLFGDGAHRQTPLVISLKQFLFLHLTPIGITILLREFGQEVPWCSIFWKVWTKLGKANKL